MAQSDECQQPRPLRRDAARNRQRILAAAAEVFTARGLQASLDDVARQAGVGVGTVYRRFPDKAALIDALFEERIESMVRLAEEALACPDAWTGLVTLLERATTIMAGDRGLRQTVMWATYGHDRVHQARRRMQPVVTAVIKRAQREGVLRDDIQATDFPFIQLMLTAAAEYGAHVRPDIWRRYLTLITDALQPRRDGTAPLPEPALLPEEMMEVMRAIPTERR